MSGEQAAVAEALDAHGSCCTQEGTTARPVMCRCGQAVETFNLWQAHRVDQILAALATVTPARLSDEERGDGLSGHETTLYGERVVCTCGDFNCASLDYPSCTCDQSGMGLLMRCATHAPEEKYADRRRAARAVQPTPPAQAEAVAAVERVRALAEQKADGKDVVRVTERPIPGVGYGQVTSTFVRQDAIRAALAPTAAEQVAAMRNHADHAARQVADVEGRRE